ncbi:hypothetical protein [Primorskyibacter sp. S87]|uniref:hypothetical protein n=1 Tax=Primorskyibacter sp. S87 TaxID=3415126 RepID=UPI003C7B0BA9
MTVSNPFRGGGSVNRADVPHYEGRPITGGGGDAGQHSLHYDPATKTGSPNVNSLIDLIVKKVRTERRKALEKTITEIMAVVQSQDTRIKSLEAALQIEQKRVTEAIGKAVEQATGDDPAPTLDELEAMAAQHKRDMKR